MSTDYLLTRSSSIMVAMMKVRSEIVYIHSPNYLNKFFQNCVKGMGQKNNFAVIDYELRANGDQDFDFTNSMNILAKNDIVPVYLSENRQESGKLVKIGFFWVENTIIIPKPTSDREYEMLKKLGLPNVPTFEFDTDSNWDYTKLWFYDNDDLNLDYKHMNYNLFM